MNNISINPFTKEKISIPKKLDDRYAIKKFLKTNSKKKVVVVQGLGFVGAVMSIVCANSKIEDYAVVGIDLPDKRNFWKIDSINKGVFPIVSSDKKVKKFFNKTRTKNNFYATYDPYVYSKADFIIVDINLDVDKKSNFNGKLIDYDVKIEPFKKAINVIGSNCREDVLILVETTVPPGTCQKIIKPIIERCLLKRGLSKEFFSLGHSYERVMPGPNYIDSIKNFYRVYSGINKNSEDKVEKFLKTIISTKKYPLTKLNNTNATEIAKVLENSYRAMNIAFITEWSRFAEESSVNLYDVVDAIRMRPTHSNLMYPGIGVGGYCLTKDPLLASWSRKNFFNSEPLNQSENGVKINDRMPLFAFNFLIQNIKPDTLKNKNILMLGVSYRSDVADTRYTPVEPLYKYCLKEKANIFLHDPFTSYWEELNLNINNNIDTLIRKKIDIIIISTAHKTYKDSRFIDKLLEINRLFILDTVGIFNVDQINILSKYHKIKILGRGDL
tara:strand:- start:101 stop:1597 length:1497 start_codon:yes stop_codon:yes gene_type:complete